MIGFTGSSASASDSDNLVVSLDHKRKVSDGVVSGVGTLFSLDQKLYASDYDFDSDSVASENQPQTFRPNGGNCSKIKPFCRLQSFPLSYCSLISPENWRQSLGKENRHSSRRSLIREPLLEGNLLGPLVMISNDKRDRLKENLTLPIAPPPRPPPPPFLQPPAIKNNV